MSWHSSRLSPMFRRVLVIAGVALGLSGCSKNYSAERLYWKAQQIGAPVIKNPRTATPEQFALAVNAFQHVVERTPGTMWAARAQAVIGSFYADQQHYDKAREAFGLVIQNYNRYSDLALGARIGIAKSYEREDRWEEAAKAYAEISAYHPWSTVGLDAPLYIATVYAKRQQPEQAKKAYERAARAYTKLIPNAPSPEMALQVKGYLALAYHQLGRWDQAVAILEEVKASTSPGVNRPYVLLALGMIYQQRLGSTDKAAELYTTLAQEFPEHPFGKLAKTKLTELGRPVPEPKAAQPQAVKPHGAAPSQPAGVGAGH